MIRGTLVGVVARAQARNGKCTYTVEVASWVRTPLPEVELVGAAKYPLHRFNTVRNELCFVNKCLYCTAARLVKPPPARWGVGGWIPPALLYLLSKSSQIFFVFVPVGMPDVCMWYVVLGMRYEVRGMRYVVQGTRYGTRGTETVCGAPLFDT
jgi:hypothetical protein